jgi:hypothetical protein
MDEIPVVARIKSENEIVRITAALLEARSCAPIHFNNAARNICHFFSAGLRCAAGPFRMKLEMRGERDLRD